MVDFYIYSMSFSPMIMRWASIYPGSFFFGSSPSAVDDFDNSFIFGFCRTGKVQGATITISVFAVYTLLLPVLFVVAVGAAVKSTTSFAEVGTIAGTISISFLWTLQLYN